MKNEIDATIETLRKRWEVPGMAVGIVKDGELFLTKGYGTKQVGKTDPVDENTLFAIASNTKAFIASSLAQLVDQGKISWKDKVRDYLPQFELYDTYVTENTTIEDLLCHRVGLGTYSGDLMWYKSTLQPAELISKLQYIPQAYGFRSGYGYSNLMFITAGEVLRSVTKDRWNEYVKDHFFIPLQMSRTITSTNELKTKGNFAVPHKPFEDGQTPIPWVNWDNMGAAGGIISSANDMCQWLIANLNSGVFLGDTIIPSNQQDILWTPHNNNVVTHEKKTEIPGHHFSGYGLGWAISDYRGNLLISHSGGYDGMYSKVMMIPDKKIGIVILTNTMKGIAAPLGLDIIDRLLEKESMNWSELMLTESEKDHSQSEEIEKREKKRSKKIEPTLSLDEYEGTYYSPIHGNVNIFLKDKKLTMEFENAPALSASLDHWHYNIWKINWDEVHAWFDFGTIQFLLDNDLTVEGMKFDVPNEDIFFDEVNLERLN